jgi:hypothetical protein
MESESTTLRATATCSTTSTPMQAHIFIFNSFLVTFFKVKIFGVPIEECVDRGERRVDVPRNVPGIVCDILSYLRATSLSIVGLFRLAGEKVATDELRRTLDSGRLEFIERF